MDRNYFDRFCFKKYGTFFITLLFFISDGLVNVQMSAGLTRSSDYPKTYIFVEEIRPISSVDRSADHLFDEKSHDQTSEQPRKSFFYIYFKFSRNEREIVFNRRSVQFLIDYEIISDSRKISGPDIKQYVEGANNVEIDVAKLYEEAPCDLGVDTYRGIRVKFKDAYYKAGLNKYKLVIRVSEAGNPSKKGELIIKPIDVSVKLNRTSNGCNNKLSIRVEPKFEGSTLDFTYIGLEENDLEGSLQGEGKLGNALLYTRQLKKIYGTQPRNVKILVHSRGNTPSWHELTIPAADGLALNVGEFERDQETNREHIPVTISIPECHVNPFYPMRIRLIYNNAQADLNNPPKSIIIPRGKSQYQFDLLLKSSVRCAKNLRIKARSADFQNVAVLGIPIPLPALNELKLEAMYHDKQENLHEHVSVLLDMDKCSSSSERDRAIKLRYEGDGAGYLISPPSTFDLSDGSKTISIYLDRQRSLCGASLKISASADDAAIVSQTITLGSPEDKTLVLSAGK